MSAVGSISRSRSRGARLQYKYIVIGVSSVSKQVLSGRARSRHGYPAVLFVRTAVDRLN